MTRADRPVAVRRWLRHPALWSVAGLVLAVWLVLLDARGVRIDEDDLDRGPRAEARPVADWDGDANLDVTYVHPSGQVVRASTHVFRTELLPEPGQSVAVRVSAKDPTSVRLVGDRYDPGAPAAYFLFALPGMVGWVARRRSLRTSERSATEPSVTYQMRAVASSPGWWSWRWRLHLYALDSPAGAEPVCSVPLIAEPSTLGDRTVEVKGTPRPWGRVVPYDAESGEVLWPSGRCLRTHGWGRRSVEPGRSIHRSTAATWSIGLGVAVCIGGAITDVFVDDSIDSDGRGYRTEAQVVGPAPGRPGATVVAVPWLGDTIRASVDLDDRPRPGSAVEVLLDPVHPDRVWAPGDDAPGGDLIGTIYLVGLVAVLTGAIARVVARRNGRQPLAIPPPPPGTSRSWPSSTSSSSLPPPPPPPAGPLR